MSIARPSRCIVRIAFDVLSESIKAVSYVRKAAALFFSAVELQQRSPKFQLFPFSIQIPQ